MAGARLSIGKATSSMITVVPVSRIPPTEGNRPLRIFQPLVLRGNVGEGGRQQGRQIGHGRIDLVDVRGEEVAALGAGFDQQRRSAFRKAADEFRHPRLVLDRSQARAIHQLGGSDRRAFQPYDRGARVDDAGEQHQRARLIGVFRHRVVGDLGDEAERPLRADHQVLEDVERIGEIDQRVQAIAGGVLDRVLATDAGSQFGISTRALAQGAQLFE